MTTIIIKSFNRAYYLDRCLTSIYQNVNGEFEIKVVDDGTPSEYLKKIEEKFPEVLILQSKQYQEKITAIKANITHGKSINGFSIPTDLWYTTVKSASQYVLVIEDDVWFTSILNIDDLISQMKIQNIPLLKLGWLGNYNDDKFLEIKNIHNNINSAIPKKIVTANKFIMDMLMYNKLKIFTILYRLGFVDNSFKRQYWSLNSILMGLYKKEYWLEVWKDAKGKVDENQQLRNAAAWYHKNRKAIFARTNQEYLKTTFQSSATGSYHEYGSQFDVNRMNFILNESWLRGEFNSLENYPKDFSDSYIKFFLDKENHPSAQFSDWLNWAQKFRDQYRKIGAEVDK